MLPRTLMLETVPEWITLTPGIVDVDPACHKSQNGQHVADPQCLPRSIQSVSRGFMDSRYRNSLSKQNLVAAGAPIDMTIEAKPIDYTFKKGHIIGLNIATEINEWILPKPYACTSAESLNVKVHMMDGTTQLFLPIVNAPRNARDLFDAGHAHH